MNIMNKMIKKWVPLIKNHAKSNTKFYALKVTDYVPNFFETIQKLIAP
jgi:hypothetical protein